MYRGLAGIWLIFALAWLALVLNQAARLLHLVVVLFRRQDQDQGETEGVSPTSLQDLPKL